MKLIFKQRLFSWLDSYDIYDEYGNVVYSVEGKLSWGHNLHILNQYHDHIGTVKEVVLTFLPRFELYQYDQCIGTITKEFTFFKPSFHIDFNGWQVKGDFMGWDYSIIDHQGRNIATISKQIFRLTDTYVIDVNHEDDMFYALMVVLAIDAQKCSNG